MKFSSFINYALLAVVVVLIAAYLNPKQHQEPTPTQVIQAIVLDQHLVSDINSVSVDWKYPPAFRIPTAKTNEYYEDTYTSYNICKPCESPRSKKVCTVDYNMEIRTCVCFTKRGEFGCHALRPEYKATINNYLD